MTTFISYVSEDEVIVCTTRTEAQTIKEFFGKDNRDLNDYNREVNKDVAVSFSPVMHKN